MPSFEVKLGGAAKYVQQFKYCAKFVSRVSDGIPLEERARRI